MRKALSALTVVAAVILAAPTSSATSAPAPDGSGDPVDVQTDRLGTLDGIRQSVVALTNNERGERGCNNLRRNAALDRAAQVHTRKMANRNRLSHQLPGEPSLGVRVTRAGYRWSMVGENITRDRATPEAAVAAWMGSQGHRRNILNCRYRHIGVGYALSDNGTPYWTQVFARPQ